MPFTTYVGDTGDPWQFQCKRSDGTFPNITGFDSSHLSLHLDPGGGGTVINCTLGTYSVADGENCIFQYFPNSAEVAAGQYTVWITITLSNGPKTFTGDTITVLAKK